MFEQMANKLEQIRSKMPALNFTAEPVHDEMTKEYFDYFGINWTDCKHYFGSFTVRNRRLAAHVFIPKRPRGTVFFCHGYTDHTRGGKYLFRYLLDQGFAIASHDHLGHGLSEGEPGHIQDFADYVHCLEGFVSHCQSHLPQPFHAIGFSLGGAVVTEYLFRHRDYHPFDKVVLLAPLVRLHKMLWVQLQYHFMKRFKSKVARTFTDNTSHEEFLEFMRRHDPLQLLELPLDWMRAYQVWYHRVKYVGVCKHPVTVIVGSNDKTVDWRYTLDFYEKKFPDATLITVPDAAHFLPGEGEPYRHQIFEAVHDGLLGHPTEETAGVAQMAAVF